MPTVEESASLLARSRKSGVHIDPAFDPKRTICWTADKYDTTSSAWIVNFKQGKFLVGTWSEGKSGFSGWTSKNHINYVKAVRSVK